MLAFRRLGIDTIPYVPSRVDEGHGLSIAAVETAVREGVTLIVTVDTGSTSVDEVAAAATHGIDVIVTDHHHLPDVLPAAVAIVNPQRADSAYPDAGLSGSGVAFTVARLLLGELAGAEAEARDLADLATIGTVSDVVADRSARTGRSPGWASERMRHAPRPGIAALLERAGSRYAGIDLETVGFVLAPRLNAAGRVGEAMDAARLLLAATPEEAATLAAVLEEANATRKDLMRVAIAEARAAFGLPEPGEAPGQQAWLDRPAPSESGIRVAGGPDAAALLVTGPWPVGILGLVAGTPRRRDRPADDRRHGARDAGRRRGPRVVPERRAARPGPCARRVRRPVRPPRRARRAPRASSCRRDRWDAFVDRFLAVGAAAAPEDPRRPLNVDLALPARLVDYGLYRDLARLAPCGNGNPEPLVASLGLTVQRVRAANGGHTQLVLRRERDVVDGIAFGRPDLAESIKEGDRIDVIARLASRTLRRARDAAARDPRRLHLGHASRAPPRCSRAPRAAPAPRRSRSMSPTPAGRGAA